MTLASEAVAGRMQVEIWSDEGAAIGEPDVLARLAAEAGFDPEEVGQVLAGDAYSAEVRADEQRAELLGIRSVPFFVVDGRYALAGAQPAQLMLQVLQDAWSAGQPAPSVASVAGDGAAPGCDDATCAVTP